MTCWMVVGEAGCADWPKACIGVMVPISNNETKNTTKTRLASFASLICEFTFLFPRCRGEVAAEVTRFTSFGHQGRKPQSQPSKYYPALIKYYPALLPSVAFYITLTSGKSIRRACK